MCRLRRRGDDTRKSWKRFLAVGTSRRGVVRETQCNNNRDIRIYVYYNIIMSWAARENENTVSAARPRARMPPKYDPSVRGCCYCRPRTQRRRRRRRHHSRAQARTREKINKYVQLIVLARVF